MQEYFNQIFKDYPWATEDTLDKVNSQLTSQSITMAQVAASMLDGDAAARIAIGYRRAVDANKKATKAQRAVAATGKISNTALKGIMSGSSPANAVADMSHEVAKLLYNAGVGIGNMVGPVKGKAAVAAKALGGASKALLYGTVAVTGIGTVYAKLLSEQEKYSRALIEFGSIAGDIDMYTTLRSEIRGLGMGFKDFNDIGNAAKPFIVSAGEDVLTGQYKLAKFINTLDQSDKFHDYGMSVQDQARAITAETEALYQLGQITEVNAMTQKRVSKSFESANMLAMFTGNALGTQRMDALKLREAARTNVDFTTAIIQNAEYIANNLGAEAAENIESAVGFMAILNQSTMGDEFNAQFQKDVNGTLADISFDKSAANNMDREYYEKLMRIGPDVAASYIKLVEDTATGKIKTPQQATDRQRELVKLIRSKEAKVGIDPNLIASNEMIAIAQVIPEAFYLADTDELISGNFYKSSIDNADSTIDVIDDFAVTFQNIQELITPGFETTGKSFDYLAKGILKFGGAISKFVGKGDQFEELLAKENAENIKTSIAQVNENNIASSIQVTIAKMDELKATQETLNEYKENPVNEEGEEIELDDEQEQNIAFQQKQLEDELLQLTTYYTALLEKRAALKRQNKLEAGAN